MERVRAYRDTKTDYVKSGTGKMRKLTVEKGLLRQTEIVQDQIQALIRCDVSLLFRMPALVLTQEAAEQPRSRQRNHIDSLSFTDARSA